MFWNIPENELECYRILQNVKDNYIMFSPKLAKYLKTRIMENVYKYLSSVIQLNQCFIINNRNLKMYLIFTKILKLRKNNLHQRITEP